MVRFEGETKRNRILPIEVRNEIRAISLKLKEAQKPLRILSSIRWDTQFENAFFERTTAPKIAQLTYPYTNDSLKFSAKEKLEELAALKDRIQNALVAAPGAAGILTRIVEDYENVVHLITSRGKPEFGDYSRKLWGSAHDQVLSDGTTIYEFAAKFRRNLDRISDDETEKLFPKVLSAEAMVALLTRRLNEAHLLEQVEVSISDKMVSDAAAGGNYIKIRKGATFSVKDVDVFIYHEAFTHIATSLNGRSQRVAQWLSFDSPRCSSTQEGLAVLMEMLSARIYPIRLRRVIDRVLIIGKVESGEKPSQIYDFLRTGGYSHRDTCSMIMRAFRGASPRGGKPFTKDVSYIKGLIECFNFIQTSLIDSRYDDIHALWAGKLSLSEVPVLVEGFESGLVSRPKWVPSILLDLDSLSGWFTCIAALGNMNDPEMRGKFRTQRTRAAKLNESLALLQ